MKTHTILVRFIDRRDEMDDIIYTGTLAELREELFHDLETGKSWEHEKGNKKINTNPTTVKSLVTNLNNAVTNAAKNRRPDVEYVLAD